MIEKVRWLIRRDMDEVLAIESASFDCPWSDDEFTRCLRQRNCIGMAAVDNHDAVYGYMIYELYRLRLHLVNFAVHPDHRLSGIGRAMLAKLQKKLSSERRKHITLEIRETNLNGQLFFKACGFRAVHMLHDFYNETDESAIVMQYRLGWPTAKRHIEVSA